MPITLITGQPGNGKTLYAMEMLEKAIKEGTRPIYVHGVEGTLPDKAKPLLDAKKWEECEDGALIFIDEAWGTFGHLQDARGAPTPQHVQALATHRHRGIDFVMTTQMTNQIYPFMRGLVGEHFHVVRQFGTSFATVYKWGELNEDVKSAGQRSKALASTWTYPKRLYGQFKSAVLHTIKPRIPWRIALIPISLVAAICAGYYAYAWTKTSSTHTGITAQGASGEAAAPAVARQAPLTAASWAKRLLPRIAGIHGSQPIFDDRKVKAEPATYCVIGGDIHGSETLCRCYTEQATIIDDVSPSVCRRTARFGQYDPFRAPFGSRNSPALASSAALPKEGIDLGGVASGEPSSIGPGVDAGKIRGKL